MPKRVPLAPALEHRPFSFAQAEALGTGRGRLAGPDLIRPFHGVRAVGDHPRHLMYAPRLRAGDRFSHTTAAELWGAPLPSGLGDLIHVTAAQDLTRPRTRGVLGHESGHAAFVLRSGVPISDATTTFVELASLLDQTELVAVGDYLILNPRVLDPHDVRPFTTVTKLRAAIGRERVPGVANARKALARVRSGVESPKETELRLLLEEAGIPRAECGFELRDAGGRSIGWFDLAWPDFKVIAEYDGDQHRSSTRQYERDIARFDAAAEADWRVIRVRASGLASRPDETVARVQRALMQARWAPIRRKNT